MRLGQAACCSMDDARAVDEQSAWVTWATFLLACLTHWPSSVTDPCAAAAMHSHASTDGLRKRPDIAVFRRSSRRILTVDPLQGGGRLAGLRNGIRCYRTPTASRSSATGR